MSENGLERLGQMVAGKIRDTSIQNLDRSLNGEEKARNGNQLQALLERHREHPEALAREMIPYIVDETITIFLQVLDLRMEDITLLVNEGGRQVSPYEYTDALGAEYFFEGGWIDLYSKQRRDIRER